MKNIDCEIYIKQLITFFEKNPGDLMILIVIEIKIPELFEKPNPKSVVEGYVQKTKWGKIILN